MACKTPVEQRRKNQMQGFGIFVLVFVGVLIVFWMLNPAFFTIYLIPIAIFASMIFIGIAAIVVASRQCKEGIKERRKSK